MKRRDAWLVGTGGAFLLTVAVVAVIAHNYWAPGKGVAIATTILLPVTYTCFVARSWIARRERKGELQAGILAALAHCTCVPAALFLLLYAGVQWFLVPLPVLIIPACALMFGWIAVLPLSIAAFWRSRLLLDLAPIACYVGIAASSLPVMLTMT